MSYDNREIRPLWQMLISTLKLLVFSTLVLAFLAVIGVKWLFEAVFIATVFCAIIFVLIFMIMFIWKIAWTIYQFLCLIADSLFCPFKSLEVGSWIDDAASILKDIWSLYI